MATRWREALDWINGSSEEPLRLVRLVARAIDLSGIAPRAVLLVGAFWALYGLISGFTSGVLEPAIDGLSQVLQSVGAARAGGGYSAVETLVARGRLAEAAEAYRERAQRPMDRVEATVRRAALLAGPLAQPETALVELQGLREHRLTAEADLRVGVALVDVYERRLSDPGRAMVELRRLIDLYPDRRATLRLRRELAMLKDPRRM
jgi:hypothetical protein